MIEMSVESIRVSLMNYQRVVILKEKKAGRYLPIWIGPAEAEAIHVKLQNLAVPRPLTHDLLTSVITSLGARINFVVVSDLRNDTFYAKIVLSFDGKEMEIDSRPSDALALAVRANTPIYAEESVLDRAGIVLDQETGQPTGGADGVVSGTEGGGDEPKQVDEGEIKKMSAFYDFINTLDLEDFDKKKS